MRSGARRSRCGNAKGVVLAVRSVRERLLGAQRRARLVLGPDVRGLQALVALHHVELDLLTLGQRLVAFPSNRREVDEDVLAAFALDEAIALLVREPLDGALGQNGTPFVPINNDGPGTEPPTYL